MLSERERKIFERAKELGFHFVETDMYVNSFDLTLDRIEELEGKIHQIRQWSEAYPKTVFIEPTKEQWAKAAKVLRDNGMTLDAISGSNMRLVLEGVKKIIDGETASA